MPLYQHTIVLLPKYAPEKLAKVFQRHAKAVVQFGGNIRGIENHGVRCLPEKTKRQFATVDGERYFWDARFVTVSFDGSPNCLKEAQRVVRNEESLIRQYVLKAKTPIELSHAHNYKNPYLDAATN